MSSGKIYECSFEVRWSDLDANFHVRHSAYADYCASARVYCLADAGFPLEKFAKVQIGPILFKETLQYLKETPANVHVKVNMAIAGRSADGRKWRIRHELFRSSDNAKVAVVEVEGAWMSTALRKIVIPPPDLATAFDDVARTADFAEF